MTCLCAAKPRTIVPDTMFTIASSTSSADADTNCCNSDLNCHIIKIHIILKCQVKKSIRVTACKEPGM